MYTLYRAPRARSLMVEMVLAEGRIPYRTVDLDMAGGEHTRAEYRQLNPAGWIPALAAPSGEVLYETPAINLWLCETHGLDLVPPPGDPDRGAFLSAFHNVTGEIEPTLKRIFYPARYMPTPDHADAIRATAWEMLADRLGRIDSRLAADGPFFLGERYSLADLQLAYWMPHVDANGRLAEHPAVERAYRAVRSRPALEPIFARLGR